MSHQKSKFYRELADANAYFSDQLFTTDWDGASDADKQKALIQATRTIDGVRYAGHKHTVAKVIDTNDNPTAEQLETADKNQIHEWPRGADSFAQSWTLAINATGGTFTLTFNGQTTSAIAYDASAATIETELEGLSNIPAGDVTVAVDTEHGKDFTITLSGSFENDSFNSLTSDASNLTGGAQTAEVLTLDDGIPDAVAWAVFEEAITLISGRDPNQEFENLVLTTDGVSSTRVSQDRSQMPPPHTAHFFTSATAWKFLIPFLDCDNLSFGIKRV